MPDYYIRTPGQDASRGPFDIAKLLTLAEAGHISENSLYYDETKEEWMPIALNEALMAQVFPQREKLSLRIGGQEDESAGSESQEEGCISVEDMLKAAEADTEETRHLKRRKKSLERAVALAPMSLGLMLLLSAISYVVPHLSVIRGAISEQLYSNILNYPFILVGSFDLLMAILLLLSVTDVYPLARGRSMLGLGFGVYLGWALGDATLMLASGLASVGIYMATISQRLSLMLLAIIMGVGGNGLMAYLAIDGRFDAFYSVVHINLIGQ